VSIDVAQAEQFSAAYFAGYPAIRRRKQAVEQQVYGDLQVRTLYGRRRYLPDVWSRSKDAKQRALRQAVNTIIQGTAADINKLALVRLHRALPDCCRLLLTVHDSVLLEVPEDRAESTSRLVRRVMQSPLPEFTVPLVQRGWVLSAPGISSGLSTKTGWPLWSPVFRFNVLALAGAAPVAADPNRAGAT
jgi:DNA polymerase-1